MKQNLLVAFFCVQFFLVKAQEIPKAVLVEHFTNTFCSVCATRNPSFYNTLNTYENVVHVAYHPSSPYPSCPLNQHNISENDARTNFYGIYGGTPRVVLNGTVVPTGANLISTTLLNAAALETSPFEIEASQTQVGNDSFYVSITIRALAPHLENTANLLVLVNEKTIDFEAQNGEDTHYDVFRKFLSNASITLPSEGNEVVYAFGSKIDQEWLGSEITTTVILQKSNKEVLQAAQSERLDFQTGINLAKIIDKILYPNPAKDYLYIDNSKLLIEKIEVYNIIGSLIYQVNLEERKQVKWPVSDYEEGSYIVRIYDKQQQIYTRKIVVDY